MTMSINRDAGVRRMKTRRTLLALGALAVAMVAQTDALADGNKFEWTKNGNNAAVKWRSFLDDAAYMTVNTRARQRRGKNTMYVKVDFYSLRCSGGQNTCYSIGAGGVIGLSEGAEWHQIGHNRLPDMSRRRGTKRSVSEPLDPDSTLMQVRVYLCYDRSITPDPCSRPRYGTMKYNSA
jgi:hypothetical protein